MGSKQVDEKKSLRTPALAAPAGAANADAGAGPPSSPPQRLWARRKQEAVLRLLRGEDIEIVSRQMGTTAAKLSQWRETFLAAGEAALKKRQPDAKDEEIARLHAKIGEITMENELLRERARAAEAAHSLRHGRSKA